MVNVTGGGGGTNRSIISTSLNNKFKFVASLIWCYNENFSLIHTYVCLFPLSACFLFFCQHPTARDVKSNFITCAVSIFPFFLFEPVIYLRLRRFCRKNVFKLAKKENSAKKRPTQSVVVGCVKGEKEMKLRKTQKRKRNVKVNKKLEFCVGSMSLF